MDQILVKPERILEHLRCNIRKPKRIYDSDDNESSKYHHPHNIINGGIEMKINFTYFNEDIMFKYFKNSICVTLVSNVTQEKCNNVVLNADNVYILKSSDTFHRIDPTEYMNLTYIGIPIVSYDNIKERYGTTKFALESLYITHIL